jgi:hypothetical protein
MRKIGLVIACLFVFIAPASAQKSEIDAVNAKWMEFFNKPISQSRHGSAYWMVTRNFSPSSRLVILTCSAARLLPGLTERSSKTTSDGNQPPAEA